MTGENFRKKNLPEAVAQEECPWKGISWGDSVMESQLTTY